MRGKGLPPLSQHPFRRLRHPSSAALRTVFLLTEAEHFLHNRDASVATLRWCSGSSRNAVRIPSGLSVQFRRNPQSSMADCVEWLKEKGLTAEGHSLKTDPARDPFGRLNEHNQMAFGVPSHRRQAGECGRRIATFCRSATVTSTSSPSSHQRCWSAFGTNTGICERCAPT